MTLIEELRAAKADLLSRWDHAVASGLTQAMEIVKRHLPAIIAEEREACAKTAETFVTTEHAAGRRTPNYLGDGQQLIAKAIRARGETVAALTEDDDLRKPSSTLWTICERCHQFVSITDIVALSKIGWTATQSGWICEKCQAKPDRLQEAERLCLLMEENTACRALLLVIEELRSMRCDA